VGIKKKRSKLFRDISAGAVYLPYTIKGYISTCSIHLLIVNKKNSILGIKTAYQCMNHVHLPAQ
jgi:hypothetical protein